MARGTHWNSREFFHFVKAGLLAWFGIHVHGRCESLSPISYKSTLIHRSDANQSNRHSPEIAQNSHTFAQTHQHIQHQLRHHNITMAPSTQDKAASPSGEAPNATVHLTPKEVNTLVAAM
jgi:hypothetical protein